MPNLNKVMLIGNVTRDPEVKYTPKGTAVAEISIAINRTFAQDGQKKEETTFVAVEAWGRTAEVAAEYVKKGRSIYVEGRLRLESWEDKQSGQKRSKMKITAEQIQFLGAAGGDNAGRERPTAQERPARKLDPAPLPAMDDDDDLPF